MGVSRCVRGYVSLHCLPYETLAKDSLFGTESSWQTMLPTSGKALRGGGSLACGAHPVVTG